MIDEVTGANDWPLSQSVTIPLLDVHGEQVFGGQEVDKVLANFGNDVLNGVGVSDTLRCGVGGTR